MRIPSVSADMMLDSDATTGAGRRSGSTLDPKRMTAKERAALRKKESEAIKEAESNINIGLTTVQREIDAINESANSGKTFDAAAAQAAKEAEAALMLANEQVENAKVGVTLAKTEEEKQAALKAIEEAKVAAAQAAAEAAKKAAADKVAADAATKAAQEAAAKAEKDAAAAKAAADKAAADAKAAADKAAADAKAAADKAASEAATAASKAAKEEAEKKAAEAKEAYEKALKAAQDAAANATAQATAAAAAAAAAAAKNNINTAGNILTTVPGPYATVAGSASAADILTKQYAEQQAAREKEQQMQRESIVNIMSDRLTRYNLTGLIPTIKRLAQEGATESTITLALQETEDYKRRFKANEERIKKGLQVLTPAEYLNLEDGYRQTLRAYGLNQFDTDDYVSQFIANDMSAAELSNRVVTAVQRVRNADPAVAATLRDYYGISDNDLVAYVLDPSQQFQKIERQVAASEIGTAARRQGIQAGVGVAEQLAAQGITQAEAQRGYATIANVLPGAEKLSQLYGSTLEGYGLAEAEQEVFNSLASAQRRRQRLTEREIAEFGGTSGTGRSSLSQQSRGQF